MAWIGIAHVYKQINSTLYINIHTFSMNNLISRYCFRAKRIIKS